jgi:hypothetical protein
VQVVEPALDATRVLEPLVSGEREADVGLAPVQLTVSVLAPATFQLKVKLEPTVCDAGFMLKLLTFGVEPQVLPFQICPEGQAQAEPFQVWPPVQMLTQLVPFHEVPAAHVTQLEPFQFEPFGQAQAEPFQACPPTQMLAQFAPFQAVPPPQGV